MDAREYLKVIGNESLEAKRAFLEESSDALVHAAELMGQCIKSGGKILIFGNGGSAADAQHMAAEMVGRLLMKDRKPLPAIALTTDTSNLTAIGNDFGFDEVFSKQVDALADAKDLLIAFSTSGKSPNVLKAVELGKKRGCKVIALTGGEGGPLKTLSDLSLNVSQGKNSCRIQETHIFAVHSTVDLLERYYL